MPHPIVTLTLTLPLPLPLPLTLTTALTLYSPRDWICTTTEFNRDMNSGVKAFASAFVLGTYHGAHKLVVY